ncbi:hypothetical protein B0H63DRAFT_133805 [Podospora didyma]|uniref:Uncharacterized protein n=1 Tax=Podospora didyma TaxID=330526 RepID=A0AAE0P0W8_9PEZI|nr:hypothetical protein B0H63DRAFT_133805 [Podospora didyma]
MEPTTLDYKVALYMGELPRVNEALHTSFESIHNRNWYQRARLIAVINYYCIDDHDIRLPYMGPFTEKQAKHFDKGYEELIGNNEGIMALMWQEGLRKLSHENHLLYLDYWYFCARKFYPSLSSLSTSFQPSAHPMEGTVVKKWPTYHIKTYLFSLFFHCRFGLKK